MLTMLIRDRSFGSALRFPNIQNTFPVDGDPNKGAAPIYRRWSWTAECSRMNGGISNLLIAFHGGYNRTLAKLGFKFQFVIMQNGNQTESYSAMPAAFAQDAETAAINF